MAFLELKDKVLSNVTSRGVGTNCMEETLVPREHGMKVIEHQDPISFGESILSTFQLDLCLIIKFYFSYFASLCLIANLNFFLIF